MEHLQPLGRKNWAMSVFTWKTPDYGRGRKWKNAACWKRQQRKIKMAGSSQASTWNTTHTGNWEEKQSYIIFTCKIHKWWFEWVENRRMQVEDTEKRRTIEWNCSTHCSHLLQWGLEQWLGHYLQWWPDHKEKKLFPFRRWASHWCCDMMVGLHIRTNS